MPATKIKLCELISGNKSFCSFCHNVIKNKKSYYFEGEITLENGISMQLTDLISSVLGSKFQNMTTSRSICQVCMEMMIKSYKFIEMCKQNAEQLYNTIETLENSLKSVEGGTNHQSLFVSLNTMNNKSQLIYDDKPSPTTCLNALRRWQHLSYNHKSSETESIKSEFPNDMDPLETYYISSTLETYYLGRKNRNKKIPINLEKKYICSFCNKVYRKKTSLRSHIESKHGTHMKLNTCDKIGLSKKNLEEKYICSFCNKVYRKKTSLRSHIKSKHGTLKKLNTCVKIGLRKKNLEEKYICDGCNKVYRNKYSLVGHIKLKHSNGVAYICSWCNKRFDAVSRLAAHIVTHTKEKKFSCDLCGGRFVTKESLLYHTRTHTGEKPYKCDQCDHRFICASRRSEHVRRQHIAPTMECDLCHSKFKTRSCLTRHLKRHFNPNTRLRCSQI